MAYALQRLLLGHLVQLASYPRYSTLAVTGLDRIRGLRVQLLTLAYYVIRRPGATNAGNILPLTGLYTSFEWRVLAFFSFYLINM